MPSFREQACSLPRAWLERTQRGYYEPHSGQVAIVPRYPAYMASGAGGWSHSGPWPYLQDIPLVFYGPGIIPPLGEVDRPATMADVAPTIATLLRGTLRTEDGRPLPEVATLEQSLQARTPRLVVTVVWDGGGWNALDHWAGSWPSLRGVMDEGISYTNATDGSSPSVTPAVHTTLGTGVFPWIHGISGIPVRDEEGQVVDSFLKGESSRFVKVPTLAERWDELNDNRALVGMVGYEPWHLGMIGQGAERAGGDKDDAAWLDTETNEWITNPDHYRLPPELQATPGLDEGLAELDAEDGEIDVRWRGEVPLDNRARWEETPAWVDYHTRAMVDMIGNEGYGADSVTDLLFTNYKQIDRVGHYFNMDSEFVNDVLKRTDAQLPVLFEALDRYVGKHKWVVVLTADHGQQPDAGAIDAYGISPRSLEADIRAEFGDVVRAVWPTELFLFDDVMRREGVTAADVARFLADYRLRDNTDSPAEGLAGAGRFDPDDRLFEMAVPSSLLPNISCEPETRPSPEESG